VTRADEFHVTFSGDIFTATFFSIRHAVVKIKKSLSNY
jgi:hypothetical protein